MLNVLLFFLIKQKKLDPMLYCLLCSHNRHSTTWQDPRKTLSTSQLNKLNTVNPPPPMPPQISNNNMTPSPQTGSSQQPVPAMQDLGPLPSNWEQATTPEGEVYFINHMDRSTTWLDPRIGKTLKQHHT